jgi:hypothetical protein
MTRCKPDTAVEWPAYDDTMPHPGREDLGAAVGAFAGLRRRRGGDGAGLSEARRILVIVSSSRGGSTLVGEMFRRTPGFLTLRAETNPLFVVAGLEPTPAERRAALAAELAAESGRPAAALTADNREDFVAALAWRLTAQWPAAGIDPDAVEGWTDETLEELAATDPAWAPPNFPDRVTFHLRLLARVRAAHPTVNPWYYDIPADRVRAAFPDVPVPDGPPGESLVEMPPFVLVGPWHRAGRADFAEAPLVLTTPRNSFRLSFLRTLFPSASMEVLHLVRNPGAAVNGLIDGWRHRGFFNTPVEVPLRIAGYTDELPAWGDRWWNYDFWPGWEQWADAPLPMVCAEQWRSHHAAVLDWVAETGTDYRRLRYEDVVSGAAAAHLPPLMATAPPTPGRWTRRADLILPAVRSGPMREMAERLGYGGPAEWR